jgi:hypothetical protein
MDFKVFHDMLGFFKGSDNVVSHRILSLSGLEPWPGFI